MKIFQKKYNEVTPQLLTWQSNQTILMSLETSRNPAQPQVVSCSHYSLLIELNIIERKVFFIYIALYSLLSSISEA